MRRRIILTDDQRAELFQGLGRAQSAGLDAAHTLKALEGICNGTLDQALIRTRNAVSKGRPLTTSLDAHGLLGEMDHVLLTAAEETGSIGAVCLKLAERYRRAWVRWQQMKGRMLLPGAVFVIGVLVMPLPALASGALSVTGYVVRAGAMLLLLVMLVKLFSSVVRQWRASGTPGWLTGLARLLPVAGPMSRLHERADACERLALALQCGLPAREAMEGLRRAENNPVREAALINASSKIAGGIAVAESLQDAHLLDPAGFAIVSTGEAAGRLDDSLQRVVNGCHDTLDGYYDQLARWLPVAVYFGVGVFVIAGLLG